MELVGIGPSFTATMYKAQETAGEYIIFYSLTETQTEWKEALSAFTFWYGLFVNTTVTVLCNTVCIPVIIRFQVSEAFISVVETHITLKGGTST